MKAKGIALALLVLGVLCASVSAASALAPEKPAWFLDVSSLPTNFAAGVDNEIFLVATNLGAAPTTAEQVTLIDTLPAGLKPTDWRALDNEPASPSPSCMIAGQVVTCTDAGPVGPGRQLEVRIFVEVQPLAEGSLPNEASVKGGGAKEIKTKTEIEISSDSPPFDFLSGPGGFSAPLTEADGGVATAAGSHPYALTTIAGFPTQKHPGAVLVGAGHLRDITVDFPRGQIINPAATSVRCTEAELVTEASCPASSQIGTITIRTVESFVKASTSPLYNMVPPPGTAASLGFDALGTGVYVHLSGEVRNDGDYGLSGTSHDVLALTNHPIFGARVELWGDPSSPSHNGVRGKCIAKGYEDGLGDPPCAISTPDTNTALLTTPSDCPGKPKTTSAAADSWEAPGVFVLRDYEGANLGGNTVPLKGCDELEFNPSITAVRPTTNLTDSPSGLDVNLHQPQNFDPKERSTAILKDITLTLPEGLVVNPSQAQGLGACGPEQVGLVTAVHEAPIRFTKPPDDCPDAAKIGSVEVSTPLLGQFNDENEVQRDSNGNVIPEPLPGSIYLAKPFANPFGSLLAVYLTVDDPQTGVVAKLAGKVEADPITGRLTTRFEENPELPLEDARVHLFGGPRGALRTPPACATYTSNARMTPWSAPNGLDVDRSDSFAIRRAPDGGPCPASAPTAPNRPSFLAGTISAQAGAYSPFVLKLAREDGSQNLGGFEATMPAGLSAKLAGLPACSEAQIAAAKSRSEPNDGGLELANPSCPTASEIGSVDVAAGAGPTPLHTAGRIYLAGPYNNAPLSVVIITPAVAGPFDLGVVVVRAAIYLDPETTVVRTISDPLPTILEGIPLDLRSAVVRLGRAQFTLNPTSCEPKSVFATATSVFGQSVALSSSFEVGGCKALPYKPKLHTRLFGPIHRGGHPRLRAIFEATPGEANTARISFALPRSEFIDQAHFRTICTRVQFAAKQCPAGSVYGHVKAISPLLDYPLEGPIYLRSSSHELPDVVAALRGPSRQPLEVNLAGRVDSINGGVRTTFEVVPDAPVTKAIVTLQGAKKGLFQNSTNICKGTHRATLKLIGQNGKRYEEKPLLKADCPKNAKKKGKGARR